MPRTLGRIGLAAAFAAASLTLVAGQADAAIVPAMTFDGPQDATCTTDGDGSVTVAIGANLKLQGGVRSTDQYRIIETFNAGVPTVIGPFNVPQTSGSLPLAPFAGDFAAYPATFGIFLQTLRNGTVVHQDTIAKTCSADGSSKVTATKTDDAAFTWPARRWTEPVGYVCAPGGGKKELSIDAQKITFEGDLKDTDQYRWSTTVNSQTALFGPYTVEKTSGTLDYAGFTTDPANYPFDWELRLDTVIDGKVTHTSAYRGRCSADGTGTVTPIEADIDATPFGTWAKFVAQQYSDLTDTTPISSISSSWVALLNSGVRAKGDLIESLRRGADNTQKVDPTVRLYRAFLGRTPDAGGLKFWVGRRRAGTWTLTRMADSFAASSEFKAKYGTLTNRQFVTRIYTDVLGRTADATGVNYWTGKLDRKEKTRGQVMVGFSESSEYKRKQAENTDASVAYIFLLGRKPTDTELNTWVSAQKDGESPINLATQLLESRGYLSRFGQ